MRQVKVSSKAVLVTLVLLGLSQISTACPCGCGGARALSLHPGESTRVYVYMQEEENKGYIANDGEAGADYGPISNQRFGVAAAQRFTEHLSLSAELAVSRNWHHSSGTDAAMADPSTSLLYAFHPIDLSAELGRLNFSTSLGYKNPVAHSMTDISRKDHNLDVHGNGSRETLLTGDVTWDLFTFGFSTSLTAVQRQERPTVRGDKCEPHYGYLSQLGVFYQIPGIGRSHLAMSRDYLTADRMDGRELPNSARLSHQVELGQQVRLADKRTLILSYATRGFASVDYNSPMYSVVRMGIGQSF